MPEGKSIVAHLAHVDDESKAILIWVTAQRMLANITIERSIHFYMDLNGLHQRHYERLLQAYKRRARDVKETLGIDLEPCRTCPEPQA